MYKVYIIRGFENLSRTLIPPIANSFQPSSIFSSQTILDEPPSKITQSKLVVDLEIKKDTKCGRVGCKECECLPTTVATTPDYGIFKNIYNDWIAGGKIGGVVIIKSSTTTLLQQKQLESLLYDANEYSNQAFDVFYFAKWLDRPDQFENLHTYADGQSKMVRTWNAHGLQAVAFTQAGFKKVYDLYGPENTIVCRPFSQILNSLLQNGTLYGVTTTPSAMQYDSCLVTETAFGITSDMSNSFVHSYLRASECRGSSFPDRPLNRRISYDLTFFWIIIVAIIVIITTWVLLNIGSLYK
jgi:hypothetical protein